MKCVTDILGLFCRLSGQQVSQEKTSIIFSKNVGRSTRDQLRIMSGFREKDSSLWKNIVNLWQEAQRNILWTVGDGKSVDAWNDVWIEPNLQIKDMNLVILNELMAVKVADLVNDEGDWRWELLNAWLPLEVLHKIEAIPPPHIIHGSDVRGSFSGDHENYLVAALYQELERFQNNITNSNWRMIWKLAVPERVRCFMWLMKHERLLTNYSKSRMGIRTATCAYCGSIPETVLHAMRDCALAINADLDECCSY